MPQINPILTGGGIVFATPAELISKALEDIGVVGFGRSANANEIRSGLQTLNAMLDMWGVLRENISIRKSENFPLAIGQYQYGIGIGSSDFDTVRPIKIEQAYYKDANNTDIPIACGMTEGEYSDIALKGQDGFPTRLFYKPDSPFGVISFDFAPTTAIRLFINSWKPLAKITDPNDLTALAYPDGYEAAILFNLEVMLCTPNKKPVPPEVKDNAVMSLQAIQAAYGEIPTITNWDMAIRKARIGSFFNLGNDNG